MGWVGPSAYFLGIGWYFATCVVLGVLGGRWLDRQFGTSPTFGLIGTLVGLALALYGGYRMLAQRVLNSRRPPPEGDS